MATGFQTVYSVDFPSDALPGSFGAMAKIRAGKNIGNETQQVSTIDIGTIQANAIYAVTLTPPDGAPPITVEVNSGTSNATQTRNAIVTALRSSGIFSYMIPRDGTGNTYTLTGRIPGVSYNLSISNTHSSYTLSTVEATTAVVVPFGRIVARKASYPEAAVSLPTAAGDVLLGVSVIDPSSVRVGYGHAAVTGYARNEMVSYTDDGDVYLEAETAIGISSALFFRHAVNGSLNRLGALSSAPGTGKAAVPEGFSLRVLRPSITLPSGQIVVYCRVRG